jgi:hypothetical protein
MDTAKEMVEIAQNSPVQTIDAGKESPAAAAKTKEVNRYC